MQKSDNSDKRPQSFKCRPPNFLVQRLEEEIDDLIRCNYLKEYEKDNKKCQSDCRRHDHNDRRDDWRNDRRRDDRCRSADCMTEMKNLLALFGPSLEDHILEEALGGLKSNVLERLKKTSTTL
ncbi:hypothetical protein TIFTF001_022917 [Ficus carica]|uniref:Uncharacterized protein n=1 Tax=Ficus carica TaxID=3494 RepID=A0AA88ADK3_FICCA|nr:hypothetical protein TIFTF001_022917 [Ficus carica]